MIRKVIGVVAATALGAGAVACADDENSDDVTAVPSSQAPPSSEAAPPTSGAPASTAVDDDTTNSPGQATDGAFPVTVETKFGDVTIEGEPQRVIALGWGDAETALALGVEPVGASDWLAFGGEGVGPWAEGLYDQSPEIIGTLEPSYEAIAALEPDLILDVKSSGEEPRYELLSQIAPTVGVPEGADDYLVGWPQQVRMIASALGQSENGDELIADLDQQFETAANAYPEFEGRTITVGAYSGGGYGAYVRGVGRVDFVERLGFVNNPKIDARAGEGFSVEISRERLDLLDADLTVIVPIETDASVITEDPLFQAIPSVQDDRFIILDDPSISKAFAANTALSLSYAIDIVTPRLAEALADTSD